MAIDPIAPAPTSLPSPPPASPELLRGDMQAMLSYIQGARVVSMAREAAISRLKGWLIGRLWLGLAGAAILLLLVDVGLIGYLGSHAVLISALVLIILASRSGAIVSIGRRMSNDNLGIGTAGDSIFTLASLGSGRNGVALSLLSSSVFGLMTLALFASGLPEILGLRGGIAPTFLDTASNEHREQTEADSHFAAEPTKLAAACYREASMADNPATTGAAGNQAQGTPTAAATGNAAAPAAPTSQGATLVNTAPGTTVTSSGPVLGPGATATANFGHCSPGEAALRDAQAIAADTEARASAATTLASDKVAMKSAADDWFLALARSLGLTDVPQFFKLLVWAFIAGFFEQLVPDMLDGLAARGRVSQAREAAAGK